MNPLETSTVFNGSNRHTRRKNQSRSHGKTERCKQNKRDCRRAAEKNRKQHNRRMRDRK